MQCISFKILVSSRIARIGITDPVDATIAQYMNLGEVEILQHRPEAFFTKTCSTKREDYAASDLEDDSATELNIIDSYAQALCNYVCAYMCLDDASYTSSDSKFNHLINAFYRRVNPKLVIQQRRSVQG